MGRMSDLDVILTEAAAKGEAAGVRLRAAIDAVDSNWAPTQVALGELQAAAADAYDAAVDLPIQLREFFDADDSEPTDTEPQLVRLVREIHETVVNRPDGRLVFEVDDVDKMHNNAEWLTKALRPGDIVLAKDAGLKLVNGEVTDYAPGAVVEHPPTGYGVRIYYADGTMEEIADVDGVQLANLNDGTFPFGFMAVDDEDDQPAGHRAGYWDEEGAFFTFSDREAPRPGW